jgi:hypothetical protein
MTVKSKEAIKEAFDAEVKKISVLGRPLTSGEIRWLEEIFGSEIKYEKVRVRRGVLVGVGNRAEAITLDNLISFATNTYEDDFTANPLLDVLALLAHEITHVWQRQKRVRGYWWVKALFEHIKYGDTVYDYVPDGSKKLKDYRFEQQGQIVQDYVMKRALHDPEADILERIIRRSIPPLQA